jgi:hypothetical protein|tara:strand:- start:4304 stop:4564 length:261 start_codon:yes stop_codon:yes gene_type:complete
MNIGDDPMDFDLKRDNGTYVALTVELLSDGVYTVYDDDQGEYLNVLHEPEFTVDVPKRIRLSVSEQNRLYTTLEKNYWDYQEDYVL